MFSTYLLVRSLCLLFGTIVCFSELSQSLASPESQYNTSSPSKPNFVFIITDDQDLHLSSLDYMPLVQKHLGEQGTFYKRHYCTIAICCPSRVSLLTGKAAHNTNVTDVAPPYGMSKTNQIHIVFNHQLTIIRRVSKIHFSGS